MKTDVSNRADVEKRLWKEIDHARFGMLGLVGSQDHFQPMAAFAEPAEGLIWFFTRNDTDLARETQNGAKAMFVVQARDGEFQACIGGLLSQQLDRGRIDQYWSPAVAAWYPQGKADPRLTMLRLAVQDAELWISKGGPIKYFWELAKAGAGHRPPDVGDRAHVDLN